MELTCTEKMPPVLICFILRTIAGVDVGSFQGSITNNYFNWNMGFLAISLQLTGDYE